MKTVALVFGTRPEAIKLAPVERILRHRADASCRVCVTAQHRGMLDQVVVDFGIEVDHDLNLMTPGQRPSQTLARVLEGVDDWLDSASPDLVLVQGDTTSAFGAALAAFHRRIPVGHVEAGLRTGNLDAPWPEEANRSLIARIASIHFAPTDRARRSLIGEGIRENAIEVTGNTVVDALILANERVETSRPAIPEVSESELDARRIVLVTGHRRESFGQGLIRIFEAVRTLSEAFPEVLFVFPVHPNPAVVEAVARVFGSEGRPNVRRTPPLSYLPFVRLLSRATMIITDSGGVQEEAPTFGVPVLVTRDTTERTEAVDAGMAILVGSAPEAIVREASRLLRIPSRAATRSNRPNPFGDGHAAERIVEGCVRFLARGAHSDDGPSE